ncbi:MAG: hypothetical protein JXB45_02995 [Candidatus Krumholzibacteriota bacterium]|nr:hypothetical protein [Candidatus Krumholzibacteriota bacterium]
MKNRYLKLALAVSFLLCLVVSVSRAQVPDPDSIQTVAIYRATVNTSGDWDDIDVNYDITDPDTIRSLFNEIESDTLRDCSGWKTKNSAYVYVKFLDGSRIVYHLFLDWSHFSVFRERENCYYVIPGNRARFRRHAQE